MLKVPVHHFQWFHSHRSLFVTLQSWVLTTCTTWFSQYSFTCLWNSSNRASTLCLWESQGLQEEHKSQMVIIREITRSLCSILMSYSWQNVILWTNLCWGMSQLNSPLLLIFENCALLPKNSARSVASIAFCMIVSSWRNIDSCKQYYDIHVVYTTSLYKPFCIALMRDKKRCHGLQVAAVQELD